jgi:hypothetical protein
MKNKLGSFLVTALGLLLLVYSAARSLDFIQMTLPADKAILAYFGLMALDGGLVFWLLNFLNGSRGWQRVIALIMIFVDFFGAVLMFTLDTILNTGQAGLTAVLDQNTIQAAVIALSAVIASNVGATVMHHIMDPDNLRKMAEEEARDKIESMALKEVQQNAGLLAAELAPQIGKAWMDQERANYGILLKGRKRATALPESVNAPIAIMAQEVTAKSYLPESVEVEEVLPEKTNPTRPAKSRKPKVT